MLSNSQKRLQLTIQGIVQGVGFRPFVYQLATDLGLFGWVNNSAAGVTIEIEGNLSILEQFITRLKTELPFPAQINNLTIQEQQIAGLTNFEIRHSVSGNKTAIVLPDLATCSACVAEIFDPNNRRYRYPFTNCTHCGPRYTILETLPYDRPLTTMADFQLCPDCLKEYQNPGDRRFHAQPNACPDCGPQLTFLNSKQEILATKESALQATIQAILDGKIVAIKGLGGFHLVVDASNELAVQQLRDRKGRPDKPFAVMYPDLEWVKKHCQVSILEEALLTSAPHPIVLLKQKNTNNLVTNIVPNNPNLGVMLPYTPLHHLLLKDLNKPIIATSGNLSDEPICIDEQEALQRLSTIADYFLIHNRRILRSVDDSVARIIDQKNFILRRARGYVPLPISLKNATNKSILAVGAQLKNTVAIAFDQQIFLSQHIGDLSNQISYQTFQNTIQKLSQIYDFKPDIIACDAHPDYLSSQFAQNLSEQLNIFLIIV